MSNRSDRILRRRKNDETPSSTKINSKILDNAKERSSNKSMLCDFTCEELSSSIKLDTSSEKRVRRKKIRTTLDLNCLSGASSPESCELLVTKSRKTKKNKKLCFLPKISQVVGDTSIPSATEFCDKSSESDPKIYKKLSISTERDNNVIEREKGNQTKRKLQKSLGQQNQHKSWSDQMTEKDQQSKGQNAYLVSDGQRNSDIEINLTMTRRNKKRSEGIKDAEEIKKNSMEKYATRIKDLLSDQLVAKNKKSFVPLSDEKAEQYLSNGGTSTSHHTVSEYINEGKVKVTSFSEKNRNTKPRQSSRSLYSVSPFISNTFNAKRELYIDLYREPENNQHKMKNITKVHIKRTSENVKPEIDRSKLNKRNRNKLSREDTSNFDSTIGSDDVFSNTPEKQHASKQQNANKSVGDLNDNDIQTRKSVRLDSSKSDSRRNTFNVSNGILNNTIEKMKVNENEEKLTQSNFEVQLSLSKSVTKNNGFDVTSTKIKDQIDSEKNTSQSSGTPIILSSARKTWKKLSIAEANNTKKFVESPVQIEQHKIISKNISFSENTPKLKRTATFTKEGRDDLEPNKSNIKCKSPLDVDISNPKVIDTSKVNKRRRWEKSRLSVTFLNDSLDLGNVSAPWNNISNDDVDLTEASVSNFSPTIKKLKKNLNVNFQTPPSSTSTPYCRHKTNLLKQTSLKHAKQDVKLNQKACENSATKFARTKVPNFALIHQRAYDKLESLKEMSERKAARAKLLLSGHKPPSESTTKHSNKRKELKFSPKKDNLSKSNVSVTKVNNILPSPSNAKIANKENRLPPIEKKKELLKVKSQIPKLKLPKAVINENKGFTRFGFKVRTDHDQAASKIEQVKAVAGKTKIMKDTLQERRKAIHGVRSNRRFELLMNMRKKNS